MNDFSVLLLFLSLLRQNLKMIHKLYFRVVPGSTVIIRQCCYFSFLRSLASVCHFCLALPLLKSVCSMQMGIGNDNNGKTPKKKKNERQEEARKLRAKNKSKFREHSALIQIKWIDVAVHYLCKLDAIIKDILMWQLGKKWRSKRGWMCHESKQKRWIKANRKKMAEGHTAYE